MRKNRIRSENKVLKMIKMLRVNESGGEDDQKMMGQMIFSQKIKNEHVD